MTTVANPAVFTATDMDQAIRATARYIVNLARREPISDSSFNEMMENYPPEMRDMNEELVRTVLRAAGAVPARSLDAFTWDLRKVYLTERIGHQFLGRVPPSAQPLAQHTMALFQGQIRVRVINSYAYTSSVSLGVGRPPKLVWTHELTPEGE